MVRQTSEQVSNNRLRLKVTIDAIRWLTYQACAFRGHDESLQSSNRGNFIEMVKAVASYNDAVARIVLENAPKNAKYTSPQIQKESLHILSRKVRSKIHEDIDDAKFCILIDEARDESKREQMAIILKYVDKDVFLQERFFDPMHVKDTTSLNLKKDLCAVLSHYNLDVHNLRGQGYDDASNMRREWNGLQALFLNDCPYEYYVHCLAHRLQLALVAASRNRGANQIGNLQRPGDTRWSSHFDSVCSLIKLFGPTCSVLNNLIEDGCNYKIRGDADTAFNTLKSFQFVFILHLIKDIMGITNIICQALQQKDQDIELNNKFSEKAMKLVTLSSILDPRNGYKFFNVEDICTLVNEFYPQDFMDQERIMLTFQLQHYEVEMPVHSYLKNMSTISELCRGLVETNKSKIYFLIDRLIHFVLTLSLSVSTTTTERTFSTMKLVKTQLRNMMEDEFLADYLGVSTEKEIAQTFSTDSIRDDFSSLKDCRAQLL
ncbi:uncharacterized protein LOC132309200 [Cornus florida]|uniref:uncharacterized protein LOC132309200 n=1 Tax=Cornus florida TaxID=4283 RepID=UPI00289EE3F3|nr:uncharacterized protein LOC132309200 [Cornus florida]